MNINELTPDDFEFNNREVWNKLSKLQDEELEKLLNKWDDREIYKSISDILHERKEERVKNKLLECFKELKDKDDAIDVLLQDRDITWHFLRMVFE